MNQEIEYPYNSEFRTQPAENFSVLNGFEATHAATLEIKNAKDRVAAKFMAHYVSHPQAILFHALESSAQRGLPTSLTLDWYSKAISHDGMPHVLKLSPIGEGRKIRSLYTAITEDQYKRLEEAGVKLRFTNPTRGIRGKVFPFSGRDHIKFVVSDDTSFIGGVQMDESSFQGLDFMVRIEDKTLADALINETSPEQMAESHSIPLASGDILHIDSGKRGESVILARAFEVVNKAQRDIQISSEFLPHGRFLLALYNAQQRGVAISYLHSDPKHEYIFAKPLSAVFRFSARYTPVYTHFVPDRTIHAKLLIADTVAIFGSHNFSPFSVHQGTAEIALETTNPTIVNNLRAFFQKMHQE